MFFKFISDIMNNTEIYSFFIQVNDWNFNFDTYEILFLICWFYEFLI